MHVATMQANVTVERAHAYLDKIYIQYCVKIDKRSGIVNDPNRADAPQYIVKLIGKVITVSLETVRIVEALPDLHYDAKP